MHKKKWRLPLLLVFVLTVVAPLGWASCHSDESNFFGSGAGGACTAQDFNNFQSTSQIPDGAIEQNWGTFSESGRLSELDAARIGRFLRTVDAWTEEEYAQLTSEQLAHDDNLNQVENWEALDPDAYAEAVDELTQNQVTARTGMQPTSGSIENGILAASRMDTFQANGVVASGVLGLEYDDNDDWLSADAVGSLVFADSIIANAASILGVPPTFYVKKADAIVSGCVQANDVEDTTITFYDDALQLEAGSALETEIEDCSGGVSTFTTNGGSIIVSKDQPAVHNINNGNLTLEKDAYNETVEANGSVKVEASDPHGVGCMVFEGPGTYWYSERPEKDFGINIPPQDEKYKLCIRKDSIQRVEQADGTVDFVAQEISLTGFVKYLRSRLQQGRLATLLMDVVYEGLDANTVVTMELGPGLSEVQLVSIRNFMPAGQGTLSWVNDGHYAVYEYFDGRNVTRYGHFNEEPQASFFQRYTSFFGVERPDIVFVNDTLVQIGKNNYNTTSTAGMVCESCPGQRDFSREMRDLRSRYHVEEVCRA